MVLCCWKHHWNLQYRVLYVIIFSFLEQVQILWETLQYLPIGARGSFTRSSVLCTHNGVVLMETSLESTIPGTLCYNILVFRASANFLKKTIQYQLVPEDLLLDLLYYAHTMVLCCWKRHWNLQYRVMYVNKCKFKKKFKILKKACSTCWCQMVKGPQWKPSYILTVCYRWYGW